MPRSKGDLVRTLADSWSAPVNTPIGEAGSPLICIASTYTFHAPFFESELLPRFLGLKFDEIEDVRPFVVEREQALATSRICVLVDADHLDPSQSTLRWDQFPVRVPGGAQHSKVVVLIWENYARLIVSSANLTRSGYRRNREIAGVIDFYDQESSAPRRIILDTIAFLEEVSAWVRASDTAKTRLLDALKEARARVRSWRRMPADFRPLERPRVKFVGGLPHQNGGVARSPLEQLLELWGTRRASEVIVMTPFVGELKGAVDPVVDKLLQLPRTREITGYLVVPGHPSEKDAKRMVIGLPRRFVEAWASAWRIDSDKVSTYVVPLCRAGETANRNLHAKGVLLVGDGAAMLLCGSSNFSPHGMGVGAANVEANLCYLDDPEKKRNGLRLGDRLPVDWERDFCEHPIWPETAESIDDEQPTTDRSLPAAFLWGVYNQRTAVLTVAVNPSAEFPVEWSLRWPGERLEEAPSLVTHWQHPYPPDEGRIVLQLAASLQGANIVGLRLVWRDEEGVMVSTTLPVHVESGDDLLPPEEFCSLTADEILECLLSGRDLAEWVDTMERRHATGQPKALSRKLDSLRAVDTSSYILYRMRRLGAALAALGERLMRTVRTRDAIAYRLRQDPLGPRMLMEALVREWQQDSKGNRVGADDPSVLLFSIAEINLMLAHVARRVTEAHVRPLFRDTIDEIDRQCNEITSGFVPPPNLRGYLKAVKDKYEHLLEGGTGGAHHAG